MEETKDKPEGVTDEGLRAAQKLMIAETGGAPGLALMRRIVEAALPSGVRATHRHKKRATEYVLIGYGKMQAEKWVQVGGPVMGGPFFDAVDMREVAIYRSVDDGSLWVRPREEFEDGRFEAIEPTQAPKAAREMTGFIETLSEAQLKKAMKYRGEDGHPPAPEVASGDQMEVVAFLDKVHDVLARRFPFCRDCADEDGTCPSSGLPCDLQAAFDNVKATIDASQKRDGEIERLAQLTLRVAELEKALISEAEKSGPLTIDEMREIFARQALRTNGGDSNEA